MGQAKKNTSLKREQPHSISRSKKLSDAQRVLYDLIRSKEDEGIGKWDMKRETKFHETLVKKSLESLKKMNLIKEVENIKDKRRKHYMAVEFQPSKELTGGVWYVDGKLDTEFIKILKDQCLKHIYKLKVATVEGVSELIRKSGLFKVECTTQQIAEIMMALVLDNEIMEVRSTGTGDFACIPLGAICYRGKSRGGMGGVSITGSMASIPCGVCPKISECTPNGIISPRTCLYYSKWLDF
ncbi:hypothetical protein HHK36_021463 [Tetracentron sinense]|uniref:DNA-directed RNA polymerase III subunit RPC6 n=1 Tax=Tetracentron sinense TaxID=13715 RepID=A0A834YRJ8_TETSI|nr:hypothetical protein HHK36_021463 [Tetracentron sinense]